jgi:predicted nucleic acid-binding protein
VTIGIVDTNILIEAYRRNPLAITWLESQTNLAITSVTWLELLDGARGKAGQAECLKMIFPLELIDLTIEDQAWARDALLEYRLSHGIGFADCLIASVSHRLQIPVYTRNVKDFQPMLGASLVIKPY